MHGNGPAGAGGRCLSGQRVNRMNSSSPMGNQYQYWDSVAEEKTFTHALKTNAFSRHVHRQARILDYGCGYGRTCDELVRLGYADVTGVDPSARMIRRGQRLFPHVNLHHLGLSEGGALPFEDSVFDAVVLFAVLTCIPAEADQKGLLGEIFRMLRPKGILYISDYWLQEDDRNRARYEKFVSRFGTYGVFALPEGAVVRHHSRAYMANLLHRFQILDLFDIDVVTMNGHHSIGFQCFCQKRGK